MKNLKKLLPLLTIPSAACIVTPLVASCGSNNKWEASWDYTQGIFEYTTGKHKAEAMGNSDALKAYFNAAQDNPLMLAEDIVQKLSYYETVPITRYGYNIVPLKANAMISNVRFSDGTGYISGNVKFEGLTSTTDEEGEIIILDTYANGEVQFDNIAFSYIRHAYDSTSYENLWDIMPDIFIDGAQTENWSAVLNLSLPAYGYVYNEQYDQNDTVGLIFIAPLLNAFSPDYCHYLNDVTQG